MGIPSGYTSGQVVQAVPTGINSALVCVKAETAFTSVTSITADNVFTSSYTNYLLIINATAGTNSDTTYRLRVGGVSASTNYNVQQLDVSSTSVAAIRVTGQTSALITAIGTVSSTIRLELYGPQLAAATTSLSTSNYGVSGGLILRSHAHNHTTATAYDGIEILASNAITGTYTIYGYSKTV